ncbi:MAG: hypothetical protein IT223_08905 [Crocinitomicaceae bacterium]|nr:hypothetical protein [Crocinitomicaceae bacterium]
MKYWNITVLSIFIFFLPAVIPFALNAQQSINNPYSQFGIGQLSQQGSVKNFSLGGMTAPVLDASIINFGNPASYTYLKQPVFQGSGSIGQSIFSDSSGYNSTYRGGTVSEIGLGFKKDGGKWGAAFGLTPFSRVGYNLEKKAGVNDSVTARYNYRGDGGINKLILGVSRGFTIPIDTANNMFHRLSIGANINYFFGSINHYRRAIFDNMTYFNTRVTSKTSVSDVNFDLGFLYTLPLSQVNEGKKTLRGKFLVIGADYSVRSSLNARNSEIGQSYTIFNGVEVTADTSYSFSESREDIVLPQKWKAGASLLVLGKENRSLIISAEYSTQNWRKFSSPNDTPSVSGGKSFSIAHSLSGSIEYGPRDVSKPRNLFGRIQYRAGFRTTQNYLVLSGTALRQQAVSAGFSIPFNNSRVYGQSHLHFGVEYGKGGTTSNGLLQEQFVGFQVGFSFVPYESWFQPVKYD